MTISPATDFDARSALLAVEEQLDRLIAGKREKIRWILLAMVAEGHVLLEDPPGVGKTTLAEGLARAFGADFGRIQFTADLLPADIVGVEVFEPDKKRFCFHPGPIFHQIVLADEINRATPRAQSALLEAMAERQVTVERTTYPLPRPFFVIATQNPIEQTGVFPLPEAQLDRFFMRVSLGYPDRASERRLLQGQVGRRYLAKVGQVAELSVLKAACRQAETVRLGDPVIEYALDLAEASRRAAWLRLGISPRALADWMKAARIAAWMDERDYVAAADLQLLAEPVLAHRVLAEGEVSDPIQRLLAEVPVPG